MVQGRSDGDLRRIDRLVPAGNRDSRRGKTGDAFLLGLLDTGADAIVLPRSIADAIGVELDEQVIWDIAGFAGQTASAVLGRVDIEISDGIDTLRWPAFVSVVHYDDPAEQPVLLGRTGFLQFFNAEFRGADHEVVLEPNEMFPQKSF